MKTKNYDKAFDELIKCLLKNTKDAKCVVALKHIVEEYKGNLKLKEIIVKDYTQFLAFWLPYVREKSKTSKWMQNYLLNKHLIILNRCKWFQRVYRLGYKENDDKKRMLNLVSHTEAIVKALIQTQRRKLGFDQNSTKY